MSVNPTPRTETRRTEAEALRTALASTPRPPRPSAASAALTFGWRGMRKIRHVPEQLLDVTITPVLFTLLFTYMYGGAISGSTSEYLQFILPGTLAMSVLFTTVYSGVSARLPLARSRTARTTRAPARPSSRAATSPMPLLAPVTR